MSNDGEQRQKAMIRQVFFASGMDLLPEDAVSQFATFLQLLERWNARLNLSAIRDPERIIQRHFVESVYAAQQIPAGIDTLLDYGSGGGFPGIPIAIWRPEVRVTLAESQGKKASFLREAVRVLRIRAEVFEGRVETMPSSRVFDVVTMRAVEKMELAIPVAGAHAEKLLLLLTTEQSAPGFRAVAPELRWKPPVRLPYSEQMVLLRGERA